MEEALPWKWLIEWDSRNEGHLRVVKDVIYYGRSKYQEIMVVELEELGKTLILDGKTQSSVYDEYIYHEALVQPAMVLHGGPRRVLILGGGEGATAREVLKFRSVEEVVMVDIDEEVVKVAKRYLSEMHQGAFDDPRLKLVIMDGLKYVSEVNEKFDVIIADLVDPIAGGPAYKLYTREFYGMIKERLAEGGVFVTQAASTSHTPKVHAVIYNTVKSVFKHARSYQVFVRSFNSMWGFVVASDYKDPSRLTRDYVDSKLKELLVRPNRFYDGDAHVHMFTLPRNLREVIESVSEVSTMNRPVFMPA